MWTNTRIKRRAVLSFLMASPFLSARRASLAQETAADPSDTINEQFASMLIESDALFGVLILDPSGDVLFEHNPEIPFVSASLYKLILIADILLRVEHHEMALESQIEIREEFFIAENGEDSYFSHSAIGTLVTIEELLYSAGCYSSNTGAQALFSLTSVEELDTRAVQIGLASTFYRLIADEVADLYVAQSDGPSPTEHARAVRFVQSFAGNGIVNVTTPRDVAQIFALLRDDELGSPVTSWRFKQILSARVINDRLAALLPLETEIVHKTGNLPGVLHDAGIILTPSGPVVAVAMAQALINLDETMSIEQRIGLAAYAAGSATA